MASLNKDTDVDQGRVLKLAMDAAATSLRFFRALKIREADQPARRPGRPADENWSRQRQAIAAQGRAS
jgi:hypothetical protein